MNEMTPEQVAAKIKLDREILADNAKKLAEESMCRKMKAARKIEDFKIDHAD